MTIPQSAADGPSAGPSGIPLPQTRLSRLLDGIVVWIGESTAWIWTVLMLLIVYQVVQRYVFGLGSIKMEEMQWHLYGVGFMLAIPFAEIRETQNLHRETGRDDQADGTAIDTVLGAKRLQESPYRAKEHEVAENAQERGDRAGGEHIAEMLFLLG